MNGNKLPQAKHVLDFMLKALFEINEEKAIDVIIFSGDFLEKGGEGFQHDILNGLNVFKEKVLTRITSSLGLPLSRVIFTPGNHDIDRSKIDEFAEDGIELRASSNKDVISLIEGKTSHVTSRAASFKEFEKKYYEDCEDIEYTHSDFNSQIISTINGLNIGFTAVNTIWRCGVDDANKIVMGINQLTENPINHKQLDLKIAVTHYPIDHLKEFERNDVINLLEKNYDLFCTGHTHHGGAQPLLSDKGDVAWSVNAAGTLANNIYEKDNHFKNAFQIIDYDITTGYRVRKYLQVDYTNFLPDTMYGINGVLPLPVLSSQQIDMLAKQNERKENERRLAEFRNQIYPFTLIDEFIGVSGSLMSSEFITCPAIDRIKEQLVNQSQKSLRLMALSGMGKTRIIAESFHGQDDVFYSNSSDCACS
ncbi:MAG: metallophosphoesterase, partial [Lachnospiraceae bacterium]|nr:metallophosphoesterase [Lachnospiraceae bacterium]